MTKMDKQYIEKEYEQAIKALFFISQFFMLY